MIVCYLIQLCMSLKFLIKLLKGSASQLNKLVLKDSSYIQKLSGTNLFQGLVINTYNNFKKKPCHELCQLLHVVRNCLLELATGCEQRVVADTARGRFFLKVGICIDDETLKKISTAH